MTTGFKGSKDPSQGGCCSGSGCGCQHDDTPSTVAAGTPGSATYGTGDNQVTFSAEEIASLNKIFGELDLQSKNDRDEEGNIPQADLDWLMEKFGVEKE